MVAPGIAEIEDRIGLTAGAGGEQLAKHVEATLLERLDPSNSQSLSTRADLRLWLQKQGIPPKSANTAIDTSMAKAYAHRAYLRAWRNRVNPGFSLLGLDDDDDAGLGNTSANAPPTAAAAPNSQMSEAWLKTLFAQIEATTSKLVDARSEANAKALGEATKKSIDERFAQLGLSPKTRSEIETVVADAIAKGLPPREIAIRHITADGERLLALGQQHKQFPRLLRYAQIKDHRGFSPNIWLTGPTGSGKTTAGEQVARALEPMFKSYHRTQAGDLFVTDKAGKTIDLGLTFSSPFGADSSLDADYKVIGFKDATGTFHWTTFLRIFCFGGVYVADEIDNWMPSALLALNAALANGWISTPMGMLSRHPDSIIIACANTWGLGATNDYVGRSRLDAATLDRFQPKLEWAVDEELEAAIAAKMGGTMGQQWHALIVLARTAARRQGLKIIISPRATFNGIAMLLAGEPVAEVLETTVYAGLTPEQIKALALQPAIVAQSRKHEIGLEKEILILADTGRKIEAIAM